MRARYCRTISREVTRPCSIAACISRMLDSTTVNDCLAGAAGGRLCAASRRASVAHTKECAIGCLPLNGVEKWKPTTLLRPRLLLHNTSVSHGDKSASRGRSQASISSTCQRPDSTAKTSSTESIPVLFIDSACGFFQLIRWRRQDLNLDRARFCVEYSQ